MAGRICRWASMDIDFADILMEVVDAPRLRPAPLSRRASDGADPRAADAAGGLSGPVRDRYARDHLLDPHRRPAPAPGDQLAARLRLLDPRPRALPRQRLLPARRDRRGLPSDPVRADLDRRARAARGGARVHAPPARLRARHRSDRLGQVDLAGGDDRRDQPHARGAHHDDRGPDRVPARAQEVPRQPARARLRRAELRRRAEGRPAPGPRRDPRRRDARPGDDLHRADRGRDRPPRVRHASHPGRGADDRPRDRRVPLPPAGPGAGAAVGRAAGDHDPAAAADGRRLRPRRRDRGARAQPRDPQPDPRGQDPSDLLGPADELGAGHADDGHRAGGTGAGGQDHAEARRSALGHARTSSGACSARPRWRRRKGAAG